MLGQPCELHFHAGHEEPGGGAHRRRHRRRLVQDARPLPRDARRARARGVIGGRCVWLFGVQGGFARKGDLETLFIRKTPLFGVSSSPFLTEHPCRVVAPVFLTSPRARRRTRASSPGRPARCKGATPSTRSRCPASPTRAWPSRTAGCRSR